jgi:hypothetical protein
MPDLGKIVGYEPMQDPPFGAALRQAAASMFRRVIRHRERYIRAWIAATGIRPEECELVEEVYPVGVDGVARTVVRVQRRTR